jgi:glucose-1-phosphate cytidylyltransferase
MVKKTMKVVILAGGFGTRLSEHTDSIPKPMVEIGGKPILWHIMKIYSHYGYNDFIICLGYKGNIIKEYFLNKLKYNSDVTIDFNSNEIQTHNNVNEPWKVTLIDTGNNVLTGGRIKKIQQYVDGPFLLTYGDGVADVNIPELIKHHNTHNKIATVTAVQPAGRFGGLEIENNTSVKSFAEKKRNDSSWINGGFFVCNPEIFSYIDNDQTIFESNTLEKLASENQLTSYKHYGFWECMDTLKEKNNLNNLWNNNQSTWKIW